ncbi:MAG: HU family DNA-binding protein [Spirochaetaceae bacterium]|nr:HU family DNA-binding protein [Spirochaetaceae bacterium]
MKFKVIQKNNPIEKDKNALFYPFPVYSDTLEIRDLLQEISYASSVTPSDVRAVTDSLVEILQRYLVRGNKIKVDGIGTFKLSFNGSGKETSKDVSANDIYNAKVTFLSDKNLRNYVSSNVKYEKVKTSTLDENDQNTL